MILSTTGNIGNIAPVVLKILRLRKEKVKRLVEVFERKDRFIWIQAEEIIRQLM